MTSSETRPLHILLISIQVPGFVDADLLTKLNKAATIKQATTFSDAMFMLNSFSPNAVCITDGGVKMETHAELLNALVDYTKKGGRAIFASSFSSFIRPNDVRPLFELWDLPWKCGSYIWGRSILNPRNLALEMSSLAQVYYAKALFLKNVDETSKVYVLDPGSADHIGLLGFSVENSETFAAYSPVEQGFVGYIGDANPGTKNERLLLAMCGLALEEHNYSP